MKFFVMASVFLLAVLCGTSGFAAGKGGMKAEIVKSRTLMEGRKMPVILRLFEGDGQSPLVPEAPLRLLILDPALEDFHQAWPVPSSDPGDYAFTLTPKTACGYRIWVDAGQEDAIADLPGAEDCKDRTIDRTPKIEAEAGNYRFKLILEPAVLTAGQEVKAKLIVRDKAGRYISDLESTMGTYGRMTGFYDDYRTILQTESLGDRTSAAKGKGSSSLKFSFTPNRAGFLRVFTQVRINGVDVLASFGLPVEEVVVESMDDMDDFVYDDIPEDAVPIGEPSQEEKARLEAEADLLKKAQEKAARDKKKSDLSTLFQEEVHDTDVYEDTNKEILKNDVFLEDVAPQGADLEPEDFDLQGVEEVID